MCFNMLFLLLMWIKAPAKQLAQSSALASLTGLSEYPFFCHWGERRKIFDILTFGRMLPETWENLLPHKKHPDILHGFKDWVKIRVGICFFAMIEACPAIQSVYININIFNISIWIDDTIYALYVDVAYSMFNPYQFLIWSSFVDKVIQY